MRFWDVTVPHQEDEDATVRGSTATQKIVLMDIFDTAGITATAIEFDEERQPTGECEIVHPENQE